MSMVFVIDEMAAVIRAVEKLPVLVLMVGFILVSLVLREL
jgi:hypothetical protein